MIDVKDQNMIQDNVLQDKQLRDKQLQEEQLQEEQLLDVEVLKVAFMGDVGIIKQILQAFQESFVNFQAEFDALHQAGKLLELSRLVHGLKGSSANIRAQALATQSASLQHKIDQKQDYAEAYRMLLIMLSLLDQEIENILKAY